MRALLLKPLLPLMYALGAGILSFLWYAGQGLAAVIIVLLGLLVGALTQAGAKRLLPMRPLAALKLFNARPILYGALAAALAAGAFIIGIELVVEGASETDATEVARTKEAFKEIAQTLAAAIGAYLTGLAVAAEDVDAAVGEYVRDEFRKAYTVREVNSAGSMLDLPLMRDEANGAVVVPNGSYAYLALYTEGPAGFDDWLKDGRLKRAQELEKWLAPLKSKPVPVG